MLLASAGSYYQSKVSVKAAIYEWFLAILLANNYLSDDSAAYQPAPVAIAHHAVRPSVLDTVKSDKQ